MINKEEFLRLPSQERREILEDLKLKLGYTYGKANEAIKRTLDEFSPYEVNGREPYTKGCVEKSNGYI